MSKQACVGRRSFFSPGAGLVGVFVSRPVIVCVVHCSALLCIRWARSIQTGCKVHLQLRQSQFAPQPLIVAVYMLKRKTVYSVLCLLLVAGAISWSFIDPALDYYYYYYYVKAMPSLDGSQMDGDGDRWLWRELLSLMNMRRFLSLHAEFCAYGG